MKTINDYDIVIEEWKLESDLIKFIGTNSIHEEYGFGITPQDPNEPDCCYFNVWIEMKVENSNNGTVFNGKTFNCYKIKNDCKTPTVDFFFDFVDKAIFEFAKIFNERKIGTNISNLKIPIPQIENYRNEIQQTIFFWERNIRDSGLN